MNKEFPDFDSWFKKQFGALPDPDRMMKAYAEATNLRQVVERNDRIVEEERLIRRQYDAALMSWTFGKAS